MLVESLYLGKSDRFFDGISHNGISKTLLTGGDNAVIIGTLDGEHSQRLNVYDVNGSAPTLTAGAGMGGGLVPLVPQRLGNIFSEEFSAGFAGNVYDKNGISPTLTTGQGGSREPLVVDQQPISTQGDALDVAKTLLAGYERTNMTGFNNDNAVLVREQLAEDRGSEGYTKDAAILDPEPQLVGGIGERVSNGGTQYYQQDRVYDSEGVAMAHPAQMPDGSYKYLVNYAIRKLTPKECFRLMGVHDEDYEKLTASNTQKYKQAGNSIVVDCLMAIFENMFIKECKSNTLF